jgi:WD40 repeat protein
VSALLFAAWQFLPQHYLHWIRISLCMAATCPSTHAGTEDGHIHKCSTSYSEQYLETYHGHIGPVYALQWSPFNPSLFLSCSADWTIRMWQEGRQQPLMTFQSSNKEVRA